MTVASSIIEGAHIHIFCFFAQLISFEIDYFYIVCEHEYMNMYPFQIIELAAG